MEQQGKRIFIENIIYYALITVICVAITMVLPWFWPFLGGLALAYLFKHLSEPLVKGLHLRGRVITVIIAVLFYGAVIFLFWSLATLLAGRAVEASYWFPQFYLEKLLPMAENASARFIDAVNHLAPPFAFSVSELFAVISSTTGELVSGLSSTVLTTITRWLKGFPLFLIGFVFMIVSSFYISADYPRVISFIVKQAPKRFHSLIFDIKDFLLSCLLKLLKSYIIIMVLTFLQLCLGLWALRIPGFWKFAAIIAILDVLPLIGSGGVLIPWSIYHFLTENYTMGAGLLLLYGVIAVVRNIVEPRIVGDQLGLHPVITLTAMFVGLKTLGFLGIFIAPVAALLIRYLNQTGRVRFYKA